MWIGEGSGDAPSIFFSSLWLTYDNNKWKTMRENTKTLSAWMAASHVTAEFSQSYLSNNSILLQLFLDVCPLHPVLFVLSILKYLVTVCFTDWETASDESERDESEREFIRMNTHICALNKYVSIHTGLPSCLANSLKRKNWLIIMIRPNSHMICIAGSFDRNRDTHNNRWNIHRQNVFQVSQNADVHTAVQLQVLSSAVCMFSVRLVAYQ